MERLLADAEKLTGKKYDISSYSDIIEAIHAIQTEMGITGTTAEEADKTIEGSTKAMKASWQNLLTAFVRGDNVQQATQQFGERFKIMLDNLVPAVTSFFDGFTVALDELSPVLDEKLPEILDSAIPSLIKAAGVGLRTIFKAIPKLLTSAYKGVRRAIASILNDVFGFNIDVEAENIKWPTWDEIKDNATKAWRDIQSELTKLGKWVFGETESGDIKWPTWTDFVDKATEAWNDVQLGINLLGAWIFGEVEPGVVDWPDWNDVGFAAASAFDEVQRGLDDLGAWFFGRLDTGAVDWPTWADVGEAARSAFDGIVKGLAGLLAEFNAFVFGERDDSALNWPTWDDVESAATKAYKGIQEGLAGLVEDLGEFIFGIGTTDADKEDNALGIFNEVQSFGLWLTQNKDSIAEALKTIGIYLGTYFAVSQVQGLINLITSFTLLDKLNTTGVIVAGVVTLLTLMVEHWDEIQAGLEDFGAWVNEYVLSPLEDFFQPLLDLMNQLAEFFGLNGGKPFSAEGKVRITYEEDIDADTAARLANAGEAEIKAANEAGIYWNETLGRGRQQYTKEFSSADEYARWYYQYKLEHGEEPTVTNKVKLTLDNASEADLEEQVKLFNIIVPATAKIIDVDTAGISLEVNGSNAKGLNYVPYDNYVSLLHRGEAVLTASQARQWREGDASVGVSSNAIAAAVSGALSDMVVQLGSKQVGRIFGDATTARVNRNVGRIEHKKALAYGG